MSVTLTFNAYIVMALLYGVLAFGGVCVASALAEEGASGALFGLALAAFAGVTAYLLWVAA